MLDTSIQRLADFAAKAPVTRRGRVTSDELAVKPSGAGSPNLRLDREEYQLENVLDPTYLAYFLDNYRIESQRLNGIVESRRPRCRCWPVACRTRMAEK